LAAGAKLPTHREMAKRLGVAVSTVTRGYAEAMRRGLIESTVGRGTFVKADARTGAPANGAGDDVRPFERMYLSFMSRRDAVDLSLNHPLRHGAGKRLRASL